MIGLLWFALALLVSPFRSTARLEAENAVLRQQLIVLGRTCRGRAWLTNSDRLVFVQLYRWFPSIIGVLQIIRPETLIRWHRAGFRSYWRWRSRDRGGRPQIDAELRALIAQMSVENPLWGAPRIHGELLKLGFEVAQSTVSKYMVRRHGGPSGQSWWTFLRNHTPEIAAMDLFVVPTIAFNLLYGIHHRSTGSPRARPYCCDEQPNGGLDCTPDHGSVPLGIGAGVPDPRPGSPLWFNRKAAPPCHGNSGQTYCVLVSMAERLCRTPDWVHSLSFAL